MQYSRFWSISDGDQEGPFEKASDDGGGAATSTGGGLWAVSPIFVIFPVAYSSLSLAQVAVTDHYQAFQQPYIF